MGKICLQTLAENVFKDRVNLYSNIGYIYLETLDKQVFKHWVQKLAERVFKGWVTYTVNTFFNIW